MCCKSADMSGGRGGGLFPHGQFYLSESRIDGDAV